MLRDFWFPILLTVAGIIPGFIGMYSSGYRKRIMFTLTVTLLFLAALSYIWGDPVRGPFARLTHPKSVDTFDFNAGVDCIFKIKELKDGVDFSRCISLPGNPIQLRIQKTWWSRLNIRVALTAYGNQPILRFDNDEIQYLAAGMDVNYDDYAFELVDSNREPIFQVVIPEDYGAIRVNALMRGQQTAVLLKDKRLRVQPLSTTNPPDFSLDRIFKYPSFIRRRERE